MEAFVWRSLCEFQKDLKEEGTSTVSPSFTEISYFILEKFMGTVYTNVRIVTEQNILVLWLSIHVGARER